MYGLSGIKLAAGFLAGLGVNRIVAGIIKSNIPVKGILDKTIVFCGQVAISSLVSEMAMKNIEQNIDSVVSLWKKDSGDEIESEERE